MKSQSSQLPASDAKGSYTDLILSTALQSTREYLQRDFNNHIEQRQAAYVERQEEALLGLLKNLPNDIEGQIEKTTTGNSFIIIQGMRISPAREFGYYNISYKGERAMLQSFEAIQYFEQFVQSKERRVAL